MASVAVFRCFPGEAGKLQQQDGPTMGTCMTDISAHTCQGLQAHDLALRQLICCLLADAWLRWAGHSRCCDSVMVSMVPQAADRR